jgi:hypothetical protein
VLSGVLSSPTIYSGLSGNRTSGDATYAGRYNFRIRSTTESGTPAGEGAGSIGVDARGTATVSGTLGDGMGFSCSTLVFANGIAPLDSSLYGGKGRIQGWLNFATNVQPLHVEGQDLIWYKPPSPHDQFYPGGFLTRRFLMATRYTPPPTGSNALTWSDGIIAFDGGNLPDVLGNHVHFAGNRAVVTNNLLHVALTLSSKTGLFTVSFEHPLTGRTLKGKGAVLQFDPPYEGFGFPISGLGGGWFRGIIESGSVRFLPLAPDAAP